MAQPTYDLDEFRVQDDDGTPGLGTWLANLNVAPSIGTGTGNAFIVCVQFVNTNAKDGGETMNWEYRLNTGGTWTPITTSSSVLRAVASANLTDGGDAGNVLTSRGSFITDNNSECETGNGTAYTHTASYYSEAHLSCYLVDADVANADDVYIRIVEGTGDVITYNVLPYVTVNKATTYYQSNAGSISFAGNITKKKTFKALAGVITPAGNLIKKTFKTFVGAITPSGDVTTRRNYFLTLIGAITPTGDVTTQNRFTKALAGAITFSGDIVKKTSISLAGSLTLAGDIIKKTSISLAGSITPSGIVAAVKQGTLYFQSVAGSISFSGDIRKKTATTLTGAITPAGTLAKKMFISLAGSLSTAGNLVALKLGTTYYQALEGAISFSGAIAKKTSKLFSGSITPSGIVSTSSQFFRSLAGSISFSGDISYWRKTFVSLAGSLTPSGIVSTVTTFRKALAGTFTSAGAVAKKTKKSLSGALTFSGNAAKKMFVTLAGEVTFSGLLSSVFRQLSAAIPVALSLVERSFELSLKSKSLYNALKGRIAALTLRDR